MERLRLLSGSARVRVLVGALALLALTIVVSIVVDRAVLRARLDDRIDRELDQEIMEFSLLAEGVDPETGEPFGEDVERILDVFISSNVPGEDEVLLGLVDGRPYLRSADPTYPIEQLEDLVAEWATTSDPSFRTDDTPVGDLRSLVVPIESADGARLGTMVVGMFPADEQAELDEAIRVASIVGLLSFVVAAGVAWAIAGRVLAPLRQLTEAATSIDEHDLSHRIPVEGSGELADLSKAFNAMLDRVDGAFATQRAFLDDAGHELRTPITVVRGHLELVGRDEPLPETTRDLLLDELDRMGRMVDDLLTMAKAEHPDFVLTAPVDVVDLTVDVADMARLLGERRWEVRADAVIVADLDRQRVVQAWMNLVRNAVQHTGDGDRITVFSRTDGRWVELGVADTGEGVDDADRDRIFERFGRGGSARRTHTDGAGLGLAIVGAIAEAHGGAVELTDTPGGGATFALRLPLVGRVADPTIQMEEPWPAS